MEKTIEFFLKRTGESKWDVTAIVKDADAEPVAPISQAKVEIIGFGSGLTNSQGIYLFTDVPTGSYQISAEKRGYIKQVKPLDLQEIPK